MDKTEPASEARERIETEADKYVSKLDHSMERSILLSGYMAGAITEHNRAQEEITRLKAELEREREKIVDKCKAEITRLYDDGVLYHHTAIKVLEALKAKN